MRIDNRDIPKGSKVKWNFLAAEMTVNKKTIVPVPLWNTTYYGLILLIVTDVKDLTAVYSEKSSAILVSSF